MRPLPVEIRTPRLRLRPLTDTDADALVQGVGNYEVARWLSVVPYPYALSDARSFLGSPAAQAGRAWAICHGDALVGVIGLAGELGYWLARPAWGRGFATEAAEHLLDTWFAAGGADVVAYCFDGNTGSGRVLDKIGFRPTNRARRPCRALNQEVEAVEMWLAADDWQARHRFGARQGGVGLRHLRPGDARRLFRLLDEPEFALVCDLGDCAGLLEIERWIGAQRYRGRPGFLLAVTDRFGRLIGLAGVERQWNRVSFAASSRAQSTGQADRALALFLGECRQKLGLAQFTARRAAGDFEGHRLLTRAGFAPTASQPALVTGPVVHYRLTA